MQTPVNMMIDLNEHALAPSATELGTSTQEDIVNAALTLVAGRSRSRQPLGDRYALGVGLEITGGWWCAIPRAATQILTGHRLVAIDHTESSRPVSLPLACIPAAAPG
jgi:hypothetical protein